MELLNVYPELKEALKALFVDFEDEDETVVETRKVDKEEEVNLPPLFCTLDGILWKGLQ